MLPWSRYPYYEIDNTSITDLEIRLTMPIVGAVLAAERRRRDRLAKQRSSKRSWIQGVLVRHDVSQTGGLTFQELRQFLSKLDPSREDPPTDAEVKWVIQMATKEVQRFEGEWISGKMHLEGEDLQTACEYWLMYVETYDEISEVFDKYDDGHTGFLSKAKFAACMKDLNGGVELDDEDVEEVVKKASVVAEGAVTKPGMIKALSVWYAWRDEKKAAKDAMKQLAKERANNEEWIKQIIEKYDAARHGGVTFAELTEILTELSGGSGPKDHPTEPEVKWVIQMATEEHVKFQGSWVAGKHRLPPSRLKEALSHWLMYLESRHFPAHPPGITTPSKPPNPMSTLIIERPDLTSKHVRDEISLVFDKYDTNQSGFLDKDQMASVLKDLNGGVPVKDSEVDAVLQRASAVTEGSITKPGLIKAISVWYTLEEDQKRGKQEPDKAAPDKAASACCSLQ